MGGRVALLLLLLANGLEVAKGQCGDLAIDNVLTTNTTICEGGSVSMEVFGVFPTAAVLQWQLLIALDWEDIVGENDTTIVILPGASGFYRCLATCGPGSDSTDTVTVTVNALPEVSISAEPTGPFCGVANSTLIAIGAAEYTWSPVDGLNSTTEDTVQCAVSTSTTYTVTGTDTNGCAAIDSVTIEVIAAPTASHSGDTLFCSGDPEASISFNFEGEGLWNVTINGPGGPYGETGNTSGSFTINNPEAGTYQVDTLTTASCPNDTLNNGGALEVSVNAPPSQAMIDQAPGTLCQNATGLLVALPPATGSGAWSQLNGPPVQLLLESSVSVSFAPTVLGTYVFTWVVSNDPCAADSAFATVTVTPGAPIANAGPPITFCSGADTTLQGNAAAPGTGSWTIVSSPIGSSAILSDITDENTVFTPDSAGEYVLRWTISNGACDASDSTVLITVVQSGSAPTILGTDDEPVCNGEYQTLFIQNPIDGTLYSWACDGWTVPVPVPDTTTVTVQWAYDGVSPITMTVTPSGPCQVPALIPVDLSPSPASCPKGFVYFEPHGLAILDPTANYFQWGTLDADFHFVPDSTRTEQTTFVPGLTNCDSANYAVRTSINGTQCWSTTFTCATSEMLDRPCPADDGMVQQPHVRVFPNPSNGGPVTLEAIGTGANLLNIDVSDLGGRAVSHGTLRMNGVSTTLLDIDRLDRGIYVLRAWNTDMDQTIKLVID